MCHPKDGKKCSAERHRTNERSCPQNLSGSDLDYQRRRQRRCDIGEGEHQRERKREGGCNERRHLGQQQAQRTAERHLRVDEIAFDGILTHDVRSNGGSAS